jgi:hypothetical protein
LKISYGLGVAGEGKQHSYEMLRVCEECGGGGQIPEITWEELQENLLQDSLKTA